MTLLAVAARLGVFLLASVPASAGAVCTQMQQEAKIAQINVLMQHYPARAKSLREGLHQSLLLDGEESCVSLDKVIASAK